MINKRASWEKVVEFHGHVCPGLAVGYRVAEIALANLHEVRSDDEEIIAVVENDACGIDAIMVMTGCTPGKGNLIFKDTGKQVYTFGSRTSNKAVRISVDGNVLHGDPEARELHQKVMDGTATEAEKIDCEKKREQRLKDLLTMPEENFAQVKEVDFSMPGKAQLFSSIECSACGEYAMEPRTRNKNGKIVCLDCFEEYSRTI